MPFLAFRIKTALALVIGAYALGYSHVPIGTIAIHMLQGGITALQAAQ